MSVKEVLTKVLAELNRRFDADDGAPWPISHPGCVVTYVGVEENSPLYNETCNALFAELDSQYPPGYSPDEPAVIEWIDATKRLLASA